MTIYDGDLSIKESSLDGDHIACDTAMLARVSLVTACLELPGALRAGSAAKAARPTCTRPDRRRVAAWFVERVMERQAAEFQCNQRYSCEPPCCLCRPGYGCEEADLS